MRFFNFSHNNHLGIVRIVDDLTYRPVGWWLSGHIFGRYISYAWKGWKR